MWNGTKVTNQFTSIMLYAHKCPRCMRTGRTAKNSTFPLKMTEIQYRAEKHLIYPLHIVQGQNGTFW